jgi:hypothetical protein
MRPTSICSHSFRSIGNPRQGRPPAPWLRRPGERLWWLERRRSGGSDGGAIGVSPRPRSIWSRRTTHRLVWSQTSLQPSQWQWQRHAAHVDDGSGLCQHRLIQWVRCVRTANFCLKFILSVGFDRQEDDEFWGRNILALINVEK